MTYTVKECFYTLQGEGVQAGRPAVFCRFAGCNLWTGREADRESAVCTFCDTDFVGVGPDGGKFKTGSELAAFIRSHWPANAPPDVRPFVVCTGGEPLLQLDRSAIDALHEQGFEIAVETNGTQPAPAGLDWICVSPKADAPLVLTAGTSSSWFTRRPRRCRNGSRTSTFSTSFFSPWTGPMPPGIRPSP